LKNKEYRDADTEKWKDLRYSMVSVSDLSIGQKACLSSSGR